MTNDFDMREGTTKPINVIVTDGGSPPTQIDLTGATLIWVAVNQAGTVALAKHSTDTNPTITLTTNPATPDDPSNCMINIKILPTDAQFLPVGTYEHECRVIQGLVQEVVYPLIDVTATFGVTKSYTWNESTHLPQVERPTILNAQTQARLWRKANAATD